MGVVLRERRELGSCSMFASLRGASVRWCIEAIRLWTMKPDVLLRVDELVIVEFMITYDIKQIEVMFLVSSENTHRSNNPAAIELGGTCKLQS
jgi:hypothetical protein